MRKNEMPIFKRLDFSIHYFLCFLGIHVPPLDMYEYSPGKFVCVYCGHHSEKK